MSAELLAFVAAALAAAGVGTFSLGLVATGRRQNLDQRIRDHVGLDRWAGRPQNASTASEEDRSLTADVATGLNRRLTYSSLGTIVQARLVRAGSALKPSQFILIQAAAAGLLVLLGFFLMRSAGALVQLLAPLGLGAAGFAAPLLVLGVLEQRRRRAFERQLPQAIDAMAGTLQAGSALPQAMEIIAREFSLPLSLEFSRVLRELELGVSMTDALGNLQDRVPSADLMLLSSAISIQQRIGGDLAGIFRGISHTIRERLRIRSEINVLTAQGRYSAYIITALPVLLFAYLWFVNNDYVSQLFLPGISRVLLAGGIAGIIVGYISMRKIVNIEV